MNDSTLLLRQVHPSFVQDGFASSVAFRPNTFDKGLMTVYDGDLVSAEGSWLHYTTVSNRSSAGVVGLTVQECTAEELTARPDPVPFLEHAVVDFTKVEEKSWRSKSKKLQAKAMLRGWLYQPENPE